MRSIISLVSISLEGFLPSILLLVVIIVAVVIVAIILVVVVIDVIVGVVIVVATMLWENPPMKASIIFSVFGTMFGHKTANSWNLLTPGDPIGLFYSNRLSVCIPPRQGIIGYVSSFYYMNFSWSSVPIGIVGILPWQQLVLLRMQQHPLVEQKEFKTLRDRHGNNGMSDPIGGLDTKSGVVDLIGDEDPSDEDGCTRMGDSTGVSVSLVMSSSPHSTIVQFDFDIGNTFSSTNILNYFSASPRSISPDSSNDFIKYLLDIQVFSPLHDDLKMEVIQAYDTIPPPQ
nr:hypothetical protein [Tanacetum cinerariifolium]